MKNNYRQPAAGCLFCFRPKFKGNVPIFEIDFIISRSSPVYYIVRYIKLKQIWDVGEVSVPLISILYSFIKKLN